MSFTGADTSFGLVVRRTEDGLTVADKNGTVARTTAPQLASAVLRTTEDLGPALRRKTRSHPTGKPPSPHSVPSYRAGGGERRQPG
ncbi:hypothetical protein SCANM63S_02890 [Streptomyces canarius]